MDKGLPGLCPFGGLYRYGPERDDPPGKPAFLIRPLIERIAGLLRETTFTPLRIKSSANPPVGWPATSQPIVFMHSSSVSLIALPPSR